MLDYLRLNQIASQSKEIVTLLDELFQQLCDAFPPLSRFSVVLLGDKQASNYYVRDRLIDKNVSTELDFAEHALTTDSSLTHLAFSSAIRIVNDLQQMTQTDRVMRLIALGHKSSYTVPLSYRNKTLGFLFFNAKVTHYFTNQEVQKDLAFLSNLIGQLFIHLHENQKHFQAVLSVALNMGHARDPETKEHLIRMGKYSELLARLLSQQHPEISHQFIHRIRLYAPFHDIGKYKIPDHVLFSDKRFTDEERCIMNMHTIYGEEIIEQVVHLSDAELVSQDEIAFIKHIVRHHHEHFDGAGLPDKLCADEIPLEARIVTLADVFDALLSRRAYKPEWSVDAVVDFIRTHTGQMFDPQCVAVLLGNLEQFLAIREKYLDKEEQPGKCIA
ncbi:metal-dependent phosphohydrolase [Vibrio cidicii]|uniref:Metal-dependent phosphohydrolase n=1 Tax=Vibrio cidicii TaxID=1763883 RepID=A0ABR5W5U1_9VIBR|nr:HD domain-containing phosphohydrolase [Vibrio cidicii]KYN84182.1 metal-dependent phosphohydrolase [Vibrio cidicii]KYN90594.1 metal-dependent phosphohydrolase [Vibrio cidicii]